MIATIAEFKSLLERYDEDPGQSSGALRMLSLSDPRMFLAYSQEAILNRPVSSGLRFVAGVSVNAGIAQVAIELFARDRRRGAALAKKMMHCEPRFDLAMAEQLSRAKEEISVQTILDVLDVISENDRVLPAALKLLRHPNPKVRSKAALFAAMRMQPAAGMKEIDGRVRANILENLYGMNSEAVAHIFRNYVHDENNRTAGNAILGLYQLGEADAIPLIYQAARHPEGRFRNTCAWLIGRTADARFAPVVAELMQDPDRVVRAQGIRALGELKRAGRASRPPLRVSVVRVQATQTPKDLLATVHDEAGQPVRRIAATGFVARAGGPSHTVRHYTVNEYECQDSLKVAFVFCLPPSGEGAFDSECAEVVELCSALRRSKDRWAIAKISGKTGPGLPFAINFEYSPVPTRITAMLGETPLCMAEGPAGSCTGAIVDALLDGDAGSGKPNLIFFGAAPQRDLIRMILEQRSKLHAVVHVLALSPAWASAEVEELTRATGGCFQRITGENTLKSSCFTTFSSLLHHYRLSWTDALIPTDLEVNASSGRGHATYESILERVEREPMAVG